MKRIAAICVFSFAMITATEANFVVGFDSATLQILNDFKNFKTVPLKMSLAIVGTALCIKGGYEFIAALKPSQDQTPWWRRAVPGAAGLGLGISAFAANYMLK